MSIRALIGTLLFIIVTIVLSIVSVPVALIDRSGKGYLLLSRIWSRSALFLYGIRLKVIGAENIDPNRHYVFVANHTSYLDIPAVLAGVPADIRLILRHTLTKVPIWGWSLLASPFIIINRSSASKSRDSIAKAVDTIRRGASVLLFPEGTRTPNGAMQDFKRGAFKLAFDSKAAVIPIAIRGAYEILPRTGTLPLRSGTIEVRIGAVIEFTPDATRSEREQEMAMMHAAEASVREMLL